MSNYFDIIYPDTDNDYFKKFAQYLCWRFFSRHHSNILNVGCGKGVLDQYIKNQKRYNIYGIDLREYNHSLLVFDEFKKCNIEKDEFPFSANTFDYVFSKSVIEHIYNADNMMKQTLRVLKPGGTVLFMTPDWQSQMSHFWDDYTHVHAWTLKSLVNCMKIHGFNNVQGELFYQLPFVWKHPKLKFIPKIISLLPQSMKWKDNTMTNGRDNKLIRFSKERMLLVWAKK